MRIQRRLLASCVIWLAASVFAPAVAAAEGLPPLPRAPTDLAWPTERWPVDLEATPADPARFAQVFERIERVRGNADIPETRALLVVRRGRIVFEYYAEGFSETTRFRSWSMAKSVTQALIGILARDGRLDVTAPAPVVEWRDDERAGITVRHLLQMSSGLESIDDGEMLYALDGSLRRAVRALPARYEPGSYWEYASASTVILSTILGDLVGTRREQVRDFMQEELFEPIGVRSAVPEFDHEGLFLGGSSLWATARDWARLGYLFLRGGVWDGRRILPEGWVDFVRTPAPAPNITNYGAHVWLNLPKPDGGIYFPNTPATAFNFGGASGQSVVIVPTLDLVLVRLGETQTQTEEQLAAELGFLIEAFAGAAAP